MGVQIKIDQRELDELTGASRGPVRDAFLDAVDVVVEVAEESISGRLSPPRSVDTGDLLKSVEMLGLSESRGKLTATIGSEVPHAIIIHTGRGEVTPNKPGGWLRWPNRGGGPQAFIFAKRSGPVAARPFLADGGDLLPEAVQRIERLFR